MSKNELKGSAVVHRELYGLDALTTPWKVVISGCMGTSNADVEDFRQAHTIMLYELALDVVSSPYVNRWAAINQVPRHSFTSLMIHGSPKQIVGFANAVIDDSMISSEEYKLADMIGDCYNRNQVVGDDAPLVVHTWRTQQLIVKLRHAYTKLMLFFS